MTKATNTTAPAATTKNEAPATRLCLCGCGSALNGKKSQYRPGHDARHAGNIARILVEMRNEGKPADQLNAMVERLGSTTLQTKALGMAHRLEQKAIRKDDAKLPADRKPKASKSAADVVAAEEAAHAESQITADGDSIKIGRWEYPTASKPGSDRVYRNTKRDGSGEWVEVA